MTTKHDRKFDRVLTKKCSRCEVLENTAKLMTSINRQIEHLHWKVRGAYWYEREIDVLQTEYIRLARIEIENEKLECVCEYQTILPV